MTRGLPQKLKTPSDRMATHSIVHPIGGRGTLLDPPIFPLRCDPASNMPLCLVFIKDFLDLEIQRPVVKGQTLLNILMYSC